MERPGEVTYTFSVSEPLSARDRTILQEVIGKFAGDLVVLEEMGANPGSTTNPAPNSAQGEALTHVPTTEYDKLEPCYVNFADLKGAANERKEEKFGYMALKWAWDSIVDTATSLPTEEDEQGNLPEINSTTTEQQEEAYNIVDIARRLRISGFSPDALQIRNPAYNEKVLTILAAAFSSIFPNAPPLVYPLEAETEQKPEQ